MSKESKAGRGGRDSGAEDAATAATGANTFEVSPSVCIAGRLLVLLNMSSKRESSRKVGLASKWAFIRAKMSFFGPSIASLKTFAIS
jgi:hypothetical protein